MSLTSLERVLKSINHINPDVVPVGPFAGYYASEFSKIKIFDYISDGRNIANAQYRLWEEVQHDIVVTAADTYYITQAFGMELDFYENALPTVKKLPLERLRDVNRLKIPNPHSDGRMPVYIEAVSLLSEKLGKNVAIRGTGTGPFSIAAYLIGTQTFLEKIAEIECGEAEEWEIRAIFDLMEIASETLILFLKAQMEVGENIVYIGDSLASTNMISPETYRKYAFPFHKKVIDAIKPHCEKYGAYTLLHICGNNTLTLDDFAKTGIDILEIDSKMDLKFCKERIGDSVCLLGNLSPSDIILNGSVEQVEKESQKCIENAADRGGFILGTGCFVPLGSPIENLKQMVKTARGYRYETI